MLPPRHRMRRAEDFSVAVRSGVRGGTGRLVVHLSEGGTDNGPTGDRATRAALVGFVVPKAVGGAVERNRVKRRLRAILRERMAELEPGSRLVVRALAPSATATSVELARDLDVAFGSARRKLRRRGGGRA